MQYHSFFISFMSFALGDISVKILLHEISEIFLPMFSSGTFVVSRLIFKSFIHLDFIFVYGVSWSIFFHSIWLRRRMGQMLFLSTPIFDELNCSFNLPL